MSNRATINGRSVEAPDGAVAWKYPDASEGGYWIYTRERADDLVDVNPALIEWVRDPAQRYIAIWEPTRGNERQKVAGPVVGHEAAMREVEAIPEDFHRAWVLPLEPSRTFDGTWIGVPGWLAARLVSIHDEMADWPITNQFDHQTRKAVRLIRDLLEGVDPENLED